MKVRKGEKKGAVKGDETLQVAREKVSEWGKERGDAAPEGEGLLEKRASEKKGELSGFLGIN